MPRKKEYEKKNKDEKNRDNSIIQDGASDSLHNVSNALYDSYMLFANKLFTISKKSRGIVTR